MKRRRMAEPPERNSSTLMPVCASNIWTILFAVSIGVEVYQTTLPSALAAAASTASAACAGKCSSAMIVAASQISRATILVISASGLAVRNVALLAIRIKPPYKQHQLNEGNRT